MEFGGIFSLIIEPKVISEPFPILYPGPIIDFEGSVAVPPQTPLISDSITVKPGACEGFICSAGFSQGVNVAPPQNSETEKT